MYSDKELLEAIRKETTKQEGYHMLLQQYQEPMYWFVRKMVLTHDSANDVLQNTYMRIFKSISAFQGKSSLSTWMHRIAYNEALRWMEKEQKARNTSLDELSKSSLGQLMDDPFFDGEEAHRLLHQAISQLPEKSRLVFQLKYLKEKTFKEMAEILEVNENTVKSIYYQAQKKIEKIIRIE